MKTLLLITKTLNLNDSLGISSRDIIDRLKKRFNLIVFSSDLGVAKQRYILDHNIIFRKMPSAKFFNNFFLRFLYSLTLLRVIKKVHLVHFLSDFPYCAIPAFNPFFKRPFIITAHGTYAVAPLENGFLERASLINAYRKAKKIFCISGFTQQEILKRIKLTNTVIVNNGVDYNKFQRAIFNISNSQGPNIIGVGVLKQRKGYHISIPAIVEVKKQYPDIKYYIVGNQSDRKYFLNLKDIIQKNNIEKNIVFLENVSENDLIQMYYNTNLFVLTSINVNNNFEGFGLVYLEAGACGKPVIGAFGSGAEDAIINGETGILVPQNDIQKTSEAILKLLDNKELAQKMGENGKNFAEKMNWDNVIEKYIKIYENSLSFR